jgi:acyl-[acyl carrier protein]--UDP-N-acetylglucosamine O-acyltransferase
MGALVHQFSNIGPVVMVGMGCCVRGQVEMCRTVVGEPHKVSGINKVGIKRLLGDDLLPEVLKALRLKTDVSQLPKALSEMYFEWSKHIVESH